MSPEGRPASPALTMRDVVSRTGVEAATLRMWEQRYGFPDPERLPSGHRRYSGRDVELIRQVLRDRAGGLGLKAAIGNAMRTAGGGRPVSDEASVFATLRRRRPDLIPYLLPKRTLVALSHAIEDECCARAERPLLMASFQREHFYRQAQPRWRGLAATAETAIVMADFDEVLDDGEGPIEVPIDRAEPIGREWSLVCDAPGYAALLAGWERPGQDHLPDPERAFETIWSVEPELVRDAAIVSAGIAERSMPELSGRIDAHLDSPVALHEDVMPLVTALTNRMVAYVGSGEARRLPAPHSSAGG